MLDAYRRPAADFPGGFHFTASRGFNVMLSLSTSCDDEAITAPSAEALVGARRRRCRAGAAADGARLRRQRRGAWDRHR